MNHPFASALMLDDSNRIGEDLVAVGANSLEHVRDVRKRHVARGEGGHNLTSIWLNAQGVESRHLEALGGGDQAHGADHREAAVVNLGEKRLLLSLRRHLGGEAERIPQVEWDRVRELHLVGTGELGEVAGFAATDVVL